MCCAQAPAGGGNDVRRGDERVQDLHVIEIAALRSVAQQYASGVDHRQRRQQLEELEDDADVAAPPRFHHCDRTQQTEVTVDLDPTDTDRLASPTRGAGLGDHVGDLFQRLGTELRDVLVNGLLRKALGR